eukprot:2961937-Alexandrium_andersonii.AAC.1
MLKDHAHRVRNSWNLPRSNSSGPSSSRRSFRLKPGSKVVLWRGPEAVSYTHLRAHETSAHL